MATHEKALTRPPNGERDLELWIQHAAGLIIFEDVRNYAIEQLDANLSEDARSAALKAIDHAVYGMVMVIDGVSGALKNETHRVNLAVAVQLTEIETDESIAEVNLADGDGMCMGYHGWLEGDYGKHPPMVP